MLDSAAAGAGSRQLLLGLARPEVLTSIFSLLGPFQSYSTLSLVNKHWRNVLQTPEIWTDLSYKGARKGQATWLPNCRTYYQFIALLKQPRFRKLKSLCLPTGMKLGKKNITYIARECPHLTYLNISNASGCKVPQMKQIAECWPNLTTFIMAEPTGASCVYQKNCSARATDLHCSCLARQSIAVQADTTTALYFLALPHMCKHFLYTQHQLTALRSSPLAPL
jgi:F-box-like